MSLVKVSSKGQVVIPVDVRRRLGFDKGSVVKIVVEGNKIIMTPVTEPPEEALVRAGPEAVREAMKQARKVDEEKMRGLLTALGVRG